MTDRTAARSPGGIPAKQGFGEMTSETRAATTPHVGVLDESLDAVGV